MAKVPAAKAAALVSAKINLLGGADYAVAFVSPRSASWPIVRETCRKFSRWVEEENGLALAMFGSDPKALGALDTVLELVDGWSSALLFVHGEHEPVWRVRGWLCCYIHSFHVTNLEAYCLQVAYLGAAPGVYGLPCLSPCRILNLSSVKPDHPAPLEDQVQARAVREGCFRCPNFKISNFRVPWQG